MKKPLVLIPAKKKDPPAPLGGRRCQRCGAALIDPKTRLPDYTRRFCDRKECKNADRSEQAIARALAGRSGARCLTCRRSNRSVYVVTPEGAILAVTDPRTAFNLGRIPGSVLAPSRKVALMWAKARKERQKQKGTEND